MQRFHCPARWLGLIGLSISLSLAVAATSGADEPTPGDQQLVTVVVEGVGRDRDDAERNALSNAIRQAIGVVVSADTLIKDDQLVRDRILTYSDGYVEKAEVVGEPRTSDNGLVAVTMRAVVRGRHLIEKIEAERITVSTVDGLSLYARAITERNRRMARGGHLALELEGMPSTLVAAAADTAKLRYDERSETVILPVEVRVDRDAYTAFIKRTTEKLRQLGVPETQLTSSKHEKMLTKEQEDALRNSYKEKGIKLKSADEDLYTEKHGALERIVIPSSQLPKDYFESDWNEVQAIIVCTRMDDAMRSSQWSLFRPELQLMRAFDELHEVVIHVELLDATGKQIATADKTIGRFYGKLTGPPICHVYRAPKRTCPHQIIVHPLIAQRAGLDRFGSSSFFIEFDAGWKAEQMEFSFAITPDEVKRIAKVICRVEAGAKAAQ